MTFQLIIFDLDGVLVDSEHINNQIFFEMLNDAGLPMSYEDIFGKFTGISTQDCIDQIETEFGKILPDNFKNIYRARTREAIKTKLKPVAGALTALENITHPVCIASGSGHDRIKLSLQIIGLSDKFANKIFSASDVKQGKPAPDLFLYATQQMGYSPAQCAVIEDAVPGVQAGVAAGMTVFAYTGSQTAEVLTNAGAHYVFDNMHDLPALLKIKSEVL